MIQTNYSAIYCDQSEVWGQHQAAADAALAIMFYMIPLIRPIHNTSH